MTTVPAIAVDQTTVDDIGRRLEALHVLLQEAASRTQSLTASLTDHGEHVERLASGLVSEWSGVASFCEEGEAQCDAADANATSQVSTLLATCRQHQTTADREHEETASRLDAIGADAERFTQDYGTQHATVTTATDAVAGHIDEGVQQFQAEWASLEQESIEPFVQAAGDELQQTEEEFERTTLTVQSFGEHIAQELTAAFTEWMEHLRERAGTQVQEQLVATFEETRTALEAAFGSFSDGVRSRSEHLRQEAQTLIAHVIENAQQKASEETQNAFNELVKEALERLAQEVVEQIATTQAGAATTTALSPILPELIAAKYLLQAINQCLEALDAVNPFD